MDIYRTSLNESFSDIKAKIVSILTAAHTWNDIESTASKTTFYVDDTNFVSVEQGENVLYFSAGNSTSTKVISVWATSSYYYNFSVYKSGTCLVLALEHDNNPLQGYKLSADFIIDTFSSASGVGIAAGFSDYACNMFTPTNLNANASFYRPFGSNSLINAAAAQLAPFMDSSTGDIFDTLYGVLMVPANNAFIDLNGAEWLITNGFALPTNGSKTYHYSEVTV